MRIVISIFLVVIVALVSFQEATFYVFFKLNQDYIAKNLCVEKKVKGSKCHGHCQLTKLVEESHEIPSPEMPLPSFEPNKVELFLLTNILKDITKQSFWQPCFQLTALHEFDYSNSFFHPPIA